jgi:probable F420-dependent oxidoreductase
MRLGLFNANMGPNSRPDRLAATAQAAEAAGFESLWAGEHIVLPDPQVPPSPMAPQDPALDSLIALTWAAAHTTTIRLATGIIILPQRNPVVLAKKLASLDVLSGGRLLFGVGVGYLEPEFRAIGANFARRGDVTDEYLDAIDHLLYDEHPAFHGEFAAFEGIDAHPRPRQRPVPVVIGGHSAAAFRRAVRRGHGWYGFALTPEDAARCTAELRRIAQETGREAALEITVTPRGRLTADRAAAFAAAGVDRLVPMPPPTDDGVAATIETALAAVAGL